MYPGAENMAEILLTYLLLDRAVHVHTTTHCLPTRMPVGNGHATDEAGGGVPLVTTNNDGQGGSNLTHRRQVRLRLGRRAARAAKSKRSASSDSASSLSSSPSGGSSLGSLAAACAPLPAEQELCAGERWRSDSVGGGLAISCRGGGGRRPLHRALQRSTDRLPSR